ncbi:MAG: chemotaxis protein CheA, partial [Myxococcota bacterium]
MNDDTSNLWEVFAEEAKDSLEGAEASVLAIEEAPSPEKVNQLYRQLHSLKGAARMMGLASAETLAHRAEDVVSLVRDHGLEVSPELFDLVFQSLDALGQLVALAVEHREDRPLDSAAALVPRLQAFFDANDPQNGQKALDAAKAEEGGGMIFDDEDGDMTFEVFSMAPPKKTPQEDEPSADSRELETVAIDPSELPVMIVGHAPPKPAPAPEPDFEIESPASPSPPALDPEQNAGKEPEQNAAKDPEQNGGKKDAEAEAASPPPEASTPAKQAEPPPRAAADTASKAPDRFIRLPAGKVEQVMSLVGEVHLAIGPLLLSAERDGYHAKSHRVEMLIQELQDAAAGLGLTPVAAVFQRARRLVRDLQRQTGKPLKLEIHDNETEIDRMLVDRIYDPLMHIIRNSADHGIEDAEGRAEAGKPAEGTIRLTAAQEGSQILIRVEDDGKGIDVDRVVARARERGLVGPHEEVSPEKAHQLIFAPGFSTAEAVSNLSGRGVGMDVVVSTIKELGGRTHVSSSLGHGTRVDLYLPLTLAFADVIVAELGRTLFGIPLSTVASIFRPDPEQIVTVTSNGETFIRLQDELAKVCSLQRFYNPAAACESPEELAKKVVVAVQTPAGKLALPI